MVDTVVEHAKEHDIKGMDPFFVMAVATLVSSTGMSSTWQPS
jgi:hypothetical protein